MAPYTTPLTTLLLGPLLFIGCAGEGADRSDPDDSGSGTVPSTTGVSSGIETTATDGSTTDDHVPPADDTSSMGSDDEGPDCVPFDEPCSASTQCCGFSTTPGIGDAVCVDFGTEISCSRLCNSDDDCSSGCCAPLEGVSVGACAPSSFCDDDPGPGGDACTECIADCSELNLPQCCTGVGCLCEDECATDDCPSGWTYCCGPYGDCLCLPDCPY